MWILWLLGILGTFCRVECDKYEKAFYIMSKSSKYSGQVIDIRGPSDWRLRGNRITKMAHIDPVDPDNQLWTDDCGNVILSLKKPTEALDRPWGLRNRLYISGRHGKANQQFVWEGDLLVVNNLAVEISAEGYLKFSQKATDNWLQKWEKKPYRSVVGTFPFPKGAFWIVSQDPKYHGRVLDANGAELSRRGDVWIGLEPKTLDPGKLRGQLWQFHPRNQDIIINVKSMMCIDGNKHYTQPFTWSKYLEANPQPGKNHKVDWMPWPEPWSERQWLFPEHNIHQRSERLCIDNRCLGVAGDPGIPQFQTMQSISPSQKWKKVYYEDELFLIILASNPRYVLDLDKSCSSVVVNVLDHGFQRETQLWQCHGRLIVSAFNGRVLTDAAHGLCLVPYDEKCLGQQWDLGCKNTRESFDISFEGKRIKNIATRASICVGELSNPIDNPVSSCQEESDEKNPCDGPGHYREGGEKCRWIMIKKKMMMGNYQQLLVRSDDPDYESRHEVFISSMTRPSRDPLDRTYLDRWPGHLDDQIGCSKRPEPFGRPLHPFVPGEYRSGSGDPIRLL